MTRHNIIQTIGSSYLTSNIEGGEYSYVKEAGSKAKLRKALGIILNFQNMSQKKRHLTLQTRLSQL